jgi:hypothetical protein
LGGRFGATVRFMVVGVTSRRRVFAINFGLAVSATVRIMSVVWIVGQASVLHARHLATGLFGGFWGYHALCRARVVVEIRRRKGTPTADHLKLVLNVIEGPRFPQKDG